MRKLLFTSLKDHSMAFYLQNDVLVDVYVTDDTPSCIGNIYVGKVKNIAPNIGACFVEIMPGELCFLPLKDASCQGPLNRNNDGRILEGDELTVQIVRDAIKTKQAAVTTAISISDDYFVLTLGEPTLGISNKISTKKKNLFKELLLEHQYIDRFSHVTKLVNNCSVGLILRTACVDLLDAEEGYNILLQRLSEAFCTLECLLQKAAHSACYSLLNRAKTQTIKAYEHFKTENIDEIITDNQSVHDELNAHMGNTEILRRYTDETYPLTKLYCLESKLKECLSPYVWLKSGANLVIEQTECLCTIDINSGKYSKKTTGSDMAYEINMEAIPEIARQMRIRNLSGIIIIDFINMKSNEQKEMILNTLRKYTSYDNVKTSVVDMTPLGLVEVTRKKINPSLKEQLTWL